MGQKTESHDFYCMKCGNKGIPLARKTSKQKSNSHRKKLYCLHCKAEVNHVEIKTWEDKQKFLEEFAAGAYQQEATESFEFCNKKVGVIYG